MKKTAQLLIVLSTLTMMGQNTEKADWTKMGKNSDSNFYNVQANFNTFWDGKKPKKGQGYKVFKRWENQAASRVYPSGNMSLLSSNYSNYIEWQKKYNLGLTKQTTNKEATLKTVATSNWTSLNGNTIPTGYDSGAGRINFITFDPLTPTTMYVGTPDGGLWKTTNGGSSWSTNTDFLTVIGCSGLVIHPTIPTTMYLATGDKEGDKNTIGILKSTDGGQNWQTTSLVFTPNQNYRITKLVMDPNDPLVMIVTTDGGIYKTNDGWLTSYATAAPTDNFSDIEYKPYSSSILYAASNQIYKSIDGGENWTVIAAPEFPTTNLVSRIELAVTIANSNNVYAIIANANQGFEGFYSSTDSGNNFVKKSNASTPNILHSDANPTASSVGGQAFHDLAIAVSPSDTDIITIGGINQWQSLNGGLDWTRITYWLGVNPLYSGSEDAPEPYIHADIQFITYLPGSSTTFFTTCDGGISKTTDNGVTFTDITNNLAIGQNTNIALSATNSNLLFTGLQDIGSLLYNNSSWSILSGGDGEDGFIDRTNENKMISSTVNGEFFITINGIKTNIAGLPSNGEWFSPIHQDPVDATITYAGGFPDLYKSSNLLSVTDGADATWISVGTPIGTGNILRFEIAPSNSDVIYAIKNDVISKSTNGGTTWLDITGTLPVTQAKLKNLTLSDTDSNKAWVVFSGYSDGIKVFKTIDGGTSWINVSAGLPNLPMNTIVYRNGNVNDEVYIGSDIGVYALDNLVTAAVPFFTNLPHSSVRDLEIFYTTPTTGKLRAATYGRGAWETELNTTTLGIEEIALSLSDAPVLYPNPLSDGNLMVRLKDNSKTFDYVVFNVLGAEIIKGKVNSDNNIIPLQDAANGVYIVRMKNENFVNSQKIIINK